MKRFFFFVSVFILTCIPQLSVSAQTASEVDQLEQLDQLLDEAILQLDLSEEAPLAERNSTFLTEAVEDERLLIQIPKNAIVAKNSLYATKVELQKFKQNVVQLRQSDARLTDEQLTVMFEATLDLRRELTNPTYAYGSIAKEMRVTVQQVKAKRWIAAHRSVEQIAQLQLQQIAHIQSVHDSLVQLNQAF